MSKTYQITQSFKVTVKDDEYTQSDVETYYHESVIGAAEDGEDQLADFTSTVTPVVPDFPAEPGSP